MQVLTFSIQKNGTKPEENQDAFSISDDCFAVSDGAAMGSFSQNWSRLLAIGFVEWPHIDDNLQEWIKPLQEAWHEAIDWNSPAMKRKFVRTKAEQGGFATLLGLEISNDPFQEIISYKVTAIGDSCFFQIRKKKIIKAFPIDNEEEFGNNPELLCSNSEDNPEPKILQENYQIGDILILSSDALAEWILSSDKSIKKLLRIKNQTSFDKLIDKLRKKREIKNDDTTMIMIRS